MLVVLAGCGGQDSSTGDVSGGARTPDEQWVVLSDEQAETALLATADLGEGFVIEADESTESSESSLGCLDAVEDLDGPDAATEAEVSFTDELGFTEVYSSVASFADEESGATVLQQLRESLSSCTAVDVEDDGVRFSLTVEVGDGVAIDGAEEQVAMSAVGVAESDELELPVAFDIVSLRLDNNITTVSLLQIGEGDSGQLAEYADTAVGRLEAVMAGEPVPSPEQSPADDQAQDEEPQLSTVTVGEEFAVEDWTVTVTEVVTNANDAIVAANEFNEQPQGQYVLVSYDATYGGNEPTADAWAELFFTFAGGDNVIYQTAAAVTPRDAESAPTQVRPGGTVRLDATFDVPSEAIEGGSVLVGGLLSDPVQVTY
jgi:hypothetical protein